MRAIYELGPFLFDFGPCNDSKEVPLLWEALLSKGPGEPSLTKSLERDRGTGFFCI